MTRMLLLEEEIAEEEEIWPEDQKTLPCTSCGKPTKARAICRACSSAQRAQRRAAWAALRARIPNHG